MMSEFSLDSMGKVRKDVLRERVLRVADAGG